MEPMELIMWAMCLGLGWLLFASMTGADEWLKSLLGTSKSKELEARVAKLENRLEELEKHKAA
jgi:hypothetical protein